LGVRVHLPSAPVVSLPAPLPIAHAHDGRTPDDAAWLLSGAVAAGLLALIATASTLEDARRLAAVYRPVNVAMAVGAVGAMGAAWLRPAPWLLALLLVVILSALWFYAVSRFLRAGFWGDG
jgi:hypothetical protein